MEIYIVQPNDNINDIAKKFGVSVEKLIRDNEIDNPNELVIGQTIVIVYPKQTYTVKDGDTLESISKAFEVPQMQLLRNNPYLTNRDLYPGEVITISYNTIGKITTNGYIYPFINIDVLKKTLPSLTYISIYNYRATSEGEIETYFDDSKVLQMANEYDTVPLLMLTTLSLLGEPDIEVAYSILLNEEYQKYHIEKLVYFLKSKGYYGVNVVFNYMSIANQNLYQNFVKNISDSLKKEGFLVFITINPNISFLNNEIEFEKIDYRNINQIADGILFLRFIWGVNSEPPTPVSSIEQIKVFLNYVLTMASFDKISIGKQLISYDWTLPYIPGKSKANSLTIDSALDLARSEGAIIQFDEVSQTPFFFYQKSVFGLTTDHIVWSIDARSILALVNLISEYKLNGTGLWNVMTYYAQLWLVLNSQFEINKFSIKDFDKTK